MIASLRVLAAASLVSLLPLRHAMPQSRTTPTDARKAATIRRLLELNHSAENMIKGIETMIPIQRRANQNLPDAFWDAFLARARNEVSGFIDSLIPVYAANFSQTELDQLVQFYQGPLGRHLADAQQNILVQSTEIGQRWGAGLAAKITDSLSQPGGALSELSAQAAMKSDLRNLVVAEEAYFADSVQYTEKIGTGGINYVPTTGNRILMLKLTKDGWGATIGSDKTSLTCTIYIGSTPFPPATAEGEPRCQRP